jgi:hypothetical protein
LDLSLSRRPIQYPARRSGLNKYGLISKPADLFLQDVGCNKTGKQTANGLSFI